MEALTTLYGEMMDLLACKQIYEGKARQKKAMTYDEIMALE